MNPQPEDDATPPRGLRKAAQAAATSDDARHKPPSASIPRDPNELSDEDLEQISGGMAPLEALAKPGPHVGKGRKGF